MASSLSVRVADRLQQWAQPYRGEAGYSLVGAVIGATAPEQLAELRAHLSGIVFLVPGYGTQGASAIDVAGAFDNDGLGALVNSSRGITHAYERPAYQARFGENWQAAIEQAVHDMVDDLAANTQRQDGSEPMRADRHTNLTLHDSGKANGVPCGITLSRSKRTPGFRLRIDVRPSKRG